ncbi:MAG: cytidylate kinase-like family protein [Desulfobulbaceae bacterium]|nr:cytidylate kinase-like family protein [Desulfobulbaceae bacterium]
MPIITVSRGSYYHGKSIAEKLAIKLGFSCLSRDQIIDGLEEFHLPEIKLVRGLNDAFSVLDRFPHGKKRFKAAIKGAILQHLAPGNVVYHGLVGHHFVQNISHVLKVRIIADTTLRVSEDMDRENTTEEKARFILKKDDEERRKWGMFLYGIDIQNPTNYDLVINIGKLSEDDAVELIASTVERPLFQETKASTESLNDAATTAIISARLFDFPNAAVKTKNSTVTISMKVPESQQNLINERVGELLGDIPGFADFSIQFEPYF